MIKKIKLPSLTHDDYYDGQMNGFMMALELVEGHIAELKTIYAGQYDKIAVLKRLQVRIGEDTK